MTKLGAYTGLFAEAYAAFVPMNAVLSDDVLYERYLQHRRGRTLELGCGNGRLVWRRLKAGIDAWGVDVSPDMISHGREYAVRESLDPDRISVADMADLHDHGRFDDIYCTDGTFMLTGTKDRALATLAAVARHLKPHGCFSVTLAEETMNPDGLWRWRGSATSGNFTYTAEECRGQADAPQTELVMKRISKFDDRGVMVASMSSLYRVRWWTRHEVTEVLRSAGFTSIEHIPIGRGEPWLVKGEAWMTSACI